MGAPGTTQGDWYVEGADRIEALYVARPGSGIIESHTLGVTNGSLYAATVRYSTETEGGYKKVIGDWNEVVANARQIAASGSLYDTLEWIAERCDALRGGTDDWFELVDIALKAKAALAQARGETPSDTGEKA